MRESQDKRMPEIHRRIGTWWKAVLSAAAVAVFAAGVAMANAGVNPALRQDYGELGERVLYPETDLAGSVIVASGELFGEAEALAAKLREKTGPAVRVVDAKEASEALWDENLLLLGAFGTNPMIDRLYENRLTPVDGSYPVAGGFLLHVVADPFGTARNAVVIGCRDSAGATAATEALLSRMEKGILPYTVLAGGEYPSRRFARGAFLRAERHFQDLEKRVVGADVLLRVLRDVEALGEGYAFTGDEEYGASIAKLLPAFARAVNRAEEELAGSLHGWSPLLYTTWRLLEPSPLFNQEERREIALCYRRLIRWDMRQNYVSNFAKRYEEGGIPELRRNKYIFSAFGIYLGSQYFSLFFPELSELPDWQKLSETMFGRMESLMSQDDSTDYFFHVPVTAMRYAAAAKDRKMIEEAVRVARLQTMFIDSLGSNTLVGDGTSFGRTSALYWGHSALLRAASYYSGDPFFLGVLEKVKGNESGIATWDLQDPRFMFTTGMKGEISPVPARVEVFPLDEPYYADITNPHSEMHVEKARFGELNVPMGKSFFKMVWRQGWGVEDQYMMLDGVNGAIHEHYDGNTINSLADRGRIWLSDRSYTERAEEWHNGVKIIRDGVSASKPYLVGMELLSDLPEIAISRTSANSYHGTNWNRTVFWMKGRYFLIRDEIDYLEGGDYLLQNHWHVLGEARVKESQLVAHQKERSFALVNMNGGSLRMENRRVYAGNMWRNYPYFLEGKEPNVAHLRQVKQGERAAGDRDVFVNLLVASDSADEPEVAVRRLSDDLFLTARENKVEAIGVGGAVSGGLRIEAEAFVLSEERISLAGLRRFELGETRISADAPVSLELEVASGRVFPADGESRYVAEIAPDFANRFNAAFWQLVSGAEKPAPEETVVEPEAGILRVEKWADAEGGLRDLVAAEESLGGRRVVISGGETGVLEAFGADGERLWRKEIGAGINDLEVFETNASMAVAVAGQDYGVRALNFRGEELWRRQLPEPTNIPESLIGITDLEVAKTGSGRSELVAASAYLDVYRLSLGGEVVSKMSGYHRGVNDLAIFAGENGRDRVAVAMEWRGVQIEEKGKFKSVSRSPGWNWQAVVAIPGLEAGSPRIVGGSSDGWLEMSASNPRDGWSLRLGGGVRVLETADVSGETRILAGTAGFSIYAVDLTGTVLWRTELRDRVERILPIGNGLVLAGCADGTVAVVGAGGDVLGEVRLPGGAVRAILEDSGSGYWVADAAGGIWRIRVAE